MSLFLGKHNNKPLLHSTRNEQSEEQLTAGPNKDTIFHSDLPYILEKERFLIQCKPRWFKNTDVYDPMYGTIASELKVSPLNGYEGVVPEEARRLKSLGYLYVIVLEDNNGRRYTQYPHFMFTGRAGSSQQAHIRKPWVSSAGTSICAGNAMHTITFSENKMPGGPTKKSAYNYGKRSSRYTNSPYPCTDVVGTIKTGKYLNGEFITAKHDHMLSGSSKYVQIWQLDGDKKRHFRHRIYNKVTVPASDNIATKVEIIFFNTRISGGKIYLDNEDIKDTTLPKGVYVDNKNIYLDQVPIAKKKMLTFWDQPVNKKYSNVDMLSTHPGSDSPVSRPNTTIFLSGSRGISSGCKLASCTLQVGGKYKGTGGTYPDSWCIGGPAPAAARINTDGTASLLRDKLMYTSGGYSGISVHRYTDKDSYGYYRNIQQDYFGLVDLDETYIDEGLEMDGDSIKLTPKNESVYSNTLSKESKPTYIVGDLINLKVPAQTVSNYSPPLGTTTATEMIKLTDIAAGFNNSDEPALGHLSLTPGEDNYIAKSNLKRYGRPFNTWYIPDKFQLTRGTGGISGMSGLFNFVNGKYYHVISWWAGYVYGSLGNVVVRCNMYLRREGSKLAVYYKIQSSTRNSSDVKSTLTGIKLPGFDFSMVRLTI